MTEQSTLQVSAETPVAAKADWSLPSGLQLLKDSWRIVRDRFWTLLGIIAAPTLLVIVLTLGFGFVTHALEGLSFVGIVILLAILSMVVFFVKTWVDVAIVRTIVTPSGQTSVIDSYRHAFRTVIRYWWVSVLLTLVTIGGILPLVIPGIIFATWFGFAPLLVVTDGLKGLSALQTSKIFVRGKVLAVLSRQFFLGMLLLILAAPVWIGWRLVFGPEHAKDIAEIIAFLISPFTTAYQFVILKSLRERPEVQSVDVSKRSIIILFLAAVWGIIGIILVPTALLLLTLRPITMFKRARDAQRQATMQSLRQSLELYGIERGSYPHTLPELVPTYMSELPEDAQKKSVYRYEPRQDGNGYRLCVSFEARPDECVESPQ